MEHDAADACVGRDAVREPEEEVGDEHERRGRERRHELREGRGEAVEGLPVEFAVVVGHVVGGLGAVGEAVDARERERDEVHARRRGGAQRREAGEVARRGDVGHAVAPLGEPLGELQVREQVAEREPRDDHDAQRRGRGVGVHGEDREREKRRRLWSLWCGADSQWW